MANCVKTKYASAKFAIEDIERIKKSSKREVVPTSVYRCGKCGFFHLTSKRQYSEIITELESKVDVLVKERDLLKQEVGNLQKELRIANSNVGVQARKDSVSSSLKLELKNALKTNKTLRQNISDLITQQLAKESKK